MLPEFLLKFNRETDEVATNTKRRLCRTTSVSLAHVAQNVAASVFAMFEQCLMEAGRRRDYCKYQYCLSCVCLSVAPSGDLLKVTPNMSDLLYLVIRYCVSLAWYFFPAPNLSPT